MDPRLLEHERRLAQLESATNALDVALSKAVAKPAEPLPAVAPLAIVVEETKLSNVTGSPIVTKQEAPNPVMPAGRIKLWVVYQSALQQIEVEGNLA